MIFLKIAMGAVYLRSMELALLHRNLLLEPIQNLNFKDIK